jgi:vacuolar-type H+-ATPase subunit C/Vma6
MSESSSPGDEQVIRIVLNGRSIVRRAEKYCRENGLRFAATAERSLIPSFGVSEMAVAGTPAQLRDFVLWADRAYKKGGIAEVFEGEPFMDAGDSGLTIA